MRKLFGNSWPPRKACGKYYEDCQYHPRDGNNEVEFECQLTPPKEVLETYQKDIVAMMKTKTVENDGLLINQLYICMSNQRMLVNVLSRSFQHSRNRTDGMTRPQEKHHTGFVVEGIGGYWSCNHWKLKVQPLIDRWW
jgi:hypothetical protein